MTDDVVTLLVIGGGPAGHSAAAAFREHGGEGGVVLVSADTRRPYNRPPLSKGYLRGDATEDELPMEDTAFYESRDVELRLSRKVVALDPAAQTVTVDDGSSLRFTTCVLALGSEPLTLPVPGGDDAGLMRLRSADDAVRLREAADGARTMVVIGSGFIGCEAAVSLARRGVGVVLVSQEAAPQQDRLGEAVAARLRGWLEDEGVRVLAGRQVERFERIGSSDGGHRLHLDQGEPLETDRVLVAAGVRQRVQLAQDAGATTHQGRVVTDVRMRTDLPGVLAAGDVAYTRNAVAGRHLAVEHWGEALAMGEVAGATAAGAQVSWAEVPGFWSEIGDRVIKYVAWGDGWDDVRLVEHEDGGFTAWYGRDGITVGVLTYQADDDDERGRALVEAGAPLPEA